MKLGSLFSGAGALDCAVSHVFGACTAWHCEHDAAASKVLAHHWPGVPNLGDITAVDWAQVEPVDILCGGWPCQPFSLAGKRKGADDEQALWPEVDRAIRALRPRILALENIPAVLGPEFSRVASSLAACGYEFTWTCLRASDVGAPHRRERLFILAADADRGGLEELAERHRGPDEPGLSASQRYDAVRCGDGAEIEAGVWGEYWPAVGRWSRLSRPAPALAESDRNGSPRLNPAFPEWMHGWPAGWVTDPAIGISRNDQLRCIGNGVVIQQAVAALRWMVSVCGVAA